MTSSIVVTGCVGEDWHKLSAETRTTVERYCAKHDLDFCFESLPQSPRPASWTKLIRLAECLVTHEEALWLDADVVVSDDSVNIFDCVPAGEIAAACVMHPPGEERHFNCGVLLVRRAFLPVLVNAAMQDDLVHHKWWEQAAINRLASSRIFQLPEEWNVWRGTSPDVHPRFRHACGMGDVASRRAWLFGDTQ